MNEVDNLSVEQSAQDDNSIPESNTDSAPVQVEVEIPEYTVENPLPVQLVEEAEVQQELEVFSVSGTYNGTISDTYLDYFEGIVQKLMPNEHYVIWRTGQYAYSMCYGEDIALDGYVFSGSGQFVEIYRDSDNYSSNWYVREFADEIDIDATGLFVYSDLGMFPTVKRGFSSVESTSLLFSIAFCFVFGVVTLIFNNVKR